MASVRAMLRPPLVWIVVAVVGLGVVLCGVGLALTEPWKLLDDNTVQEAAPGAPSGSAAPTDGAGRPAGPRTLARGTFLSHEHKTTGSVVILELSDGSRVLRLENLDTSNGPDLRVWITDAEVIPGTDGWFVFDDGEHVELGELKANKGSHNYPIPAEADLTRLTSVSIWCARFHVSFGAAALTPVG